jgi:hypothetical protein
MKKILLLLFLLVIPGQAYSWQLVTVEKYFEQGQSPGAIREQALQSGFRQAVSQEMDEIVPGRLSEERKAALMNYLDDRVQGLVQSYRQVSRVEDDQAMILEMEVNIDTESLRAMLRKVGAYFTSDSSWPYDLNTRGASPEDFSLLRELQLITGTIVDGNANTSLSLGKTADGLWSGYIVHDDINMSASAHDLKQVWFDLWEYFFSRPEIESIFVQRLILVTSGWSSTDSIMNFDGDLKNWDKEIEQSKIISVHSAADSLGATWQIQSLSPDLLLQEIEKHLVPQAVSYSIQK